ncbi:75k gamma secalin [Pyrenophora seminiperda CCB06]|uniref:75k gamma secalin n=1 Tax=Pyrenophora seminiperda CCB06 TaxID=1302712 RepID=A0A3M7ME35_9PLEO|nr:75k gamma secalin [Pyrenophora seminiperda CCB06]
MACMDTVLKDFNMPPRDEAKLRLRYASLMIEETDIEATVMSCRIEEILSKQISLCGRHRLQDLKFAALHLQARYQFKTNHRAGLKSLDKPISEAETFQHIAWVYALRFLKVTLALQIPGRVEVVPALQQLHAIQGHAERKGDRAIYVACCALEAMVHLRSGVADRLEQAHRAIAAARSLQLQVTAKDLGSFGTLLDLVDIASGIASGSPDMAKADALIVSMLDKNREDGSSENGTFTVLIERSFGGNLTFDTGGVFRKNAERKDELVFSWLPMEDLRALCFHISALDSHIHQKGMHYMNEAHQRFRESAKRRTISGIPPSVTRARIDWNLVLDWYSMFAIGLMAQSHDDHTTVSNVLSELKKRISLPPYNNTAAFTRTLAYLTSINDQSNGSLDSALTASSIPELCIPEKGHPTTTPARTDIALLAALNRLLILRNPTHPLHAQTAPLLQQIKPLCEDHPNQYLRTAFRLVHTFQGEAEAISHQKNTVQRAVGMARQVGDKTQNTEFLAMIMCYFVARFFAEAVGEKSIQAVLAARSQAIKNRRPLWKAVAVGLCANTYRRHGLLDKVGEAERELEGVWGALPVGLRGESVAGGGVDDVDVDGDVDAEGEEEEEEDVHVIHGNGMR